MFELDDTGSKRAGSHMRWGVKIPLRDAVQLNASLYLPGEQPKPSPAICTLTPYVGQLWHEFGIYFAAHGYPFLAVDVRGRGNSEGVFRPFIQEAADGYDVVEWVARQAFCDGQVAMWGGSYAGYTQWVVAGELPPHLSTIVPVAAAYMGVDMPMQCNIATPYLMQWLTLVSGCTSQDKLFFKNELYWGTQFRKWFESGVPFRQLDAFLGNPSETFQEWISHPEPSEYWDEYNPTSERYANISIPILTITGSYDSDQPGALMHYREHRTNRPPLKATDYLVIGPWDHFGTRAPKAEFCGLKLGPASLLDLAKLHLEWYAWTMQDGPRPDFLQKAVAYYVMGAEEWRYADTLEAITAHSEVFYLQSTCDPTDVFHSGSLTREPPSYSEPDRYVYDPRDLSHGELESTIDPESRTDQRMVYFAVGKQLIYHSAPFERDLEVSGFFRLTVWLSIDQPDTDFRVSVYEIDLDGNSVLLTADTIRARYGANLREQTLVHTIEPLRYEFERFTFISRLIKKANRLRLVVGPINSIYSQKNYNTGGVVSEESMKDARAVRVQLFHDESHPSALYVPIASARQ